MSKIIGFSMTAEGDGWGQGYGVLTALGFIPKEVDSLLHKLSEEGGGAITIEAVNEKTAPKD